MSSLANTSVLLRLNNIHTIFGTQVIHKNLSLEIFAQEILGIVGGSGSGKSLLLRLMVGIDQPQQGTVKCFPSDVEKGILFQSGALISSLTVLENVILPLREAAMVSLPLAQELALMKLDLVGLEREAAAKYPAQLSGGMVKRAGLARAIALDPPILFLDEPTAGLDPIGATGIDELIMDLRAKLQITVVIVTHDLDTLATTCDRIGVLLDKKIIVGTIKDISLLEHPWIKSYFQGVRGRRLFDGRTS